MSRPTSTLYTRDQLEALFNAWGCDDPVPGKSSKVVICFANKDEWEVDLIEVEHTYLQSDYRKRLWRATMSSRRGREVEASIQEAHVSAFQGHVWELRRQANLARNAGAFATPEDPSLIPQAAPDPLTYRRWRP